MMVPAKPRTDLCAECHAKAGLLMKSSNLAEGEKTEVNKQTFLRTINMPMFT